MKLRDILLNINNIIQLEEDFPLEIKVRTNDPFGGDMFFGLCSWDGKNLKSEDGDSYSLDDEVIKYEIGFDFREDYYPYYMTYWFESEWI